MPIGRPGATAYAAKCDSWWGQPSRVGNDVPAGSNDQSLTKGEGLFHIRDSRLDFSIQSPLNGQCDPTKVFGQCRLPAQIAQILVVRSGHLVAQNPPFFETCENREECQTQGFVGIACAKSSLGTR